MLDVTLHSKFLDTRTQDLPDPHPFSSSSSELLAVSIY